MRNHPSAARAVPRSSGNNSLSFWAAKGSASDKEPEHERLSKFFTHKFSSFPSTLAQSGQFSPSVVSGNFTLAVSDLVGEASNNP